MLVWISLWKWGIYVIHALMRLINGVSLIVHYRAADRIIIMTALIIMKILLSLLPQEPLENAEDISL